MGRVFGNMSGGMGQRGRGKNTGASPSGEGARGVAHSGQPQLAQSMLLPELLQLPPSHNQSLLVASEAGRRPWVNKAALEDPRAPQPPLHSPSLVLCL